MYSDAAMKLARAICPKTTITYHWLSQSAKNTPNRSLDLANQEIANGEQFWTQYTGIDAFMAQCQRWVNDDSLVVLYPDSPQYPDRLSRLAIPKLNRKTLYPAPVLFALGNINHAFDASLAVAIVGSRAAHKRQCHLTRLISAHITSGNHNIIVSGGALGIDSAAHEGAIASGSASTVVVLGSGFNCPYPKQNMKLFDRIIESGGVLLSEFPPNAAPAAKNFPRRNRIIAGLSDRVLISEASLRSGSLHTARKALDYKRPLAAIPGSPGCDSLIASGETTSIVTVTEAISWCGLRKSLVNNNASFPVSHSNDSSYSLTFAKTSSLSGEHSENNPFLKRGTMTDIQFLHDCFKKHDTISRSDLRDQLGCSESLLSEALVELELAGKIFIDGNLIKRLF